MINMLDHLIDQIRQCNHCQAQLPLAAKPILQAASESKVLIAGQAPGRVTHDKGIPFDDASGNRLRDWLGVNRAQFYDPKLFAVVPMGFCFPGTGKSGDIPPLTACAQKWRQPLLATLSKVKLHCVIGKYAIDWHLNQPNIDTGNLKVKTASVTEHVKQWQHYLKQGLIVLPHPSPRNNRWLKQNPWFETEVLPMLKTKIKDIIN